MYLLLVLAQAAPVPKPVEVDFPTLELTAPSAGPSLQVVAGERPPARFSSPLKVRKDFNAEIAQSVSEVR